MNRILEDVRVVMELRRTWFTSRAEITFTSATTAITQPPSILTAPLPGTEATVADEIPFGKGPWTNCSVKTIVVYR